MKQPPLRLLAPLALALAAPWSPGARAEAVQIGWLGGTPAPVATGVSWGVPWPRGVVPKGQSFVLTTAAGARLPLQTWPLVTTHVEGPPVLNPVDEAARLGTNGAAQSGLTAIEVLELCADQLPTEVPPPGPFPAGRGGRGGRDRGRPPVPPAPAP